MIRAQTGAFDRISFHGMTETGSLEMLPPSINFFSSTLRSGSSFGELYAYGESNKSKQKRQGEFQELS